MPPKPAAAVPAGKDAKAPAGKDAKGAAPASATTEVTSGSGHYIFANGGDYGENLLSTAFGGFITSFFYPCSMWNEINLLCDWCLAKEMSAKQ